MIDIQTRSLENLTEWIREHVSKDKEIVDLGIGYDNNFINEEIYNGEYDDVITVSAYGSHIQSDYFYDI